jgi:hypothetical protein
VFVDQRQVEEGEQAHFEEAIGKLERFVEDKILVRRRERAVVAESLKGAKARREETVGSSARERVEAEILGLASRQEGLERNIGALESREDEVYRKWRDEYHQLRYRTPVVTPLFQLFFQIQTQGPWDVVLKLVHTADWHLGRRFPSFPEEAQKKLSRAAWRSWARSSTSRSATASTPFYARATSSTSPLPARISGKVSSGCFRGGMTTRRRCFSSRAITIR